MNVVLLVPFAFMLALFAVALALGRVSIWALL